jgi:AraC-like DNA-binding protein
MTYTGMFLSLLILAYNGYRGINRYLSGFLFLSSFYICLQLLVAYSKNETLVAILGIGFPTLYYLAVPLAFFYVRGMLLDSGELEKKDYLHLLLFAVVLAGVLPYMLFTSLEEKREVARIIISDNWTALAQFRPNKFLGTRTNEVLKAVQGAVYIFFLWGLLYRHRHKLSGKQGKGEHRKLIRNWLLLFCSLFSLLTLTRVVYSWALTHSSGKSEFLAMTQDLHIIGAVGFFGLNIALIAFPNILYGLPVTPVFFRKQQPIPREEPTPAILHATATPPADRYAQYFSPDYLGEIEKSLAQWVSEKKYLETDVTMGRLALAVGIPYHHLSYYFNYVSGEKFIDWRNRLKIDYACQLMREGQVKSLTIEAIANSCGFSSKATFYRLFKQIHGQTPSEYLEALGNRE